MTLIRGVNSLCPCPRCLVPKERLFDLSVKHTLRTTEHTMRLHKQAANLRKKGERGELYKAHGLRPVEVLISSVDDLSLLNIFSRTALCVLPIPVLMMLQALMTSIWMIPVLGGRT